MASSAKRSAVEVAWDDVEGEHDATAEWAMVSDLLGSLDGKDRTHVSIGDVGTHLVCGGSATTGLLLHVGLDGGTHQLLAAEPVRSAGSIEVVAAGQPGEYPARFVVDLDRARAAARAFVAESALESSLEWEQVA